MQYVSKTIAADQVFRLAGFTPAPDGKYNLPNTQETADLLGRTFLECVSWSPGDERVALTVTGAMPLWAFGKIVHAAHGCVVKLTYVSPAATIVIFDHTGS